MTKYLYKVKKEEMEAAKCCILDENEGCKAVYI